MVAQVVHEKIQNVDERVQGQCGATSLARDGCVFFAGAAAFHTLSHAWLGLSGMLPMEIQFPSITITQGVNGIAIAVNALITVGLLYGARRLAR